jgi:hypothetical protein
MAGTAAVGAGDDFAMKGDSMSGSTLRRSAVLALTLCLCLLPLTSVDAAPRDHGAKITTGDTIQQFGHTLLQAIGGFLGLSRTTTATPPPPPPGGGDGIGIDPNGGFRH